MTGSLFAMAGMEGTPEAEEFLQQLLDGANPTDRTLMWPGYNTPVPADWVACDKPADGDGCTVVRFCLKGPNGEVGEITLTAVYNERDASLPLQQDGPNATCALQGHSQPTAKVFLQSCCGHLLEAGARLAA